MYTELPVCKRCCFCLPLRYGLIGWGYFKLLLSSILFYLLCIKWYKIFDVEEKDVKAVIIASCITMFVVTDIILGVTFIVGCHMKNVKIIRTFYFCSKIVFVLITIASVYMLSSAVYATYQHGKNDFVWFYRLMDVGLHFSNIFVQLYILLLVRSEIIKLKNGQKFKFVNLSDNADCTMKMEDSSVEEVGKV